MNNSKIVEIFNKMADILEIEEENPFRIRAYRRAAQTIENLSEDISQYVKEDSLVKLPGIGEDLTSKVKEFLKTGKIFAYEKLKKKIKPVLLDMLDIPGVGPKTARLLYEKLKIRSLAELQAKARAHKISGLPGVKDKTEENILKGLDFLKKDIGRMRLDVAFMTAQYIVSELKKLPQVMEISPAGSLRRMKETVRDIDILVTSRESEKIMDAFVKLPNIGDIIAKGTTKSSILTKSNIQVDLRVVSPDSYGAALMYFTGSKAHNIKMREMASKMGLKINEYGVFRVKGDKKIAGKSESEIFSLFNMPYIEPELRENTGEIEMALHGKLPKLAELKDIKCDFHVHTESSDGVLSLGEIAKIAKKKGYKYVVISDHSVSLKIAGGLSEKRLLKQIESIRNFNQGSKDIKLLAGSEVDILEDGSLDYSDVILEKLDFVIAAIHSGFRQSKDKLTARIVKAMQNRYVNLIAHPSGRLIGQRSAYELDYERIFSIAKETGAAIEINAYPERLDLTDVNCKRARQLGVKLAIGTDTHVGGQFDNMIYGVSVAKRGWVEKKGLLNYLALEELKDFVEQKRRAKLQNNHRPYMKNKLLALYDGLYKTFGPQHWWPARTKFEVIVGAILTQNTAWANVEKAIANLAREKLLNPSSLKNIKKKKLAFLIKPSGYYNIKADRLKSFLNFLYKKYDGSLRKMFSRDVQNLRLELLEVKGLGKETVDSILLYAGKKPIFVVDAYTRRILSRHNLIFNSDYYDDIQKLFMDNLPCDESLFGEYHALLVKLAKDICKKMPRCDRCPVRDIL